MFLKLDSTKGPPPATHNVRVGAEIQLQDPRGAAVSSYSPIVQGISELTQDEDCRFIENEGCYMNTFISSSSSTRFFTQWVINQWC